MSIELSDFLSSGGATIKATYRGVITMGVGVTIKTANIPAVDLANSVIRFTGDGAATASPGGKGALGTVKLLNTTQVQAERGDSSADPMNIGYEVVEYEGGVAQVISVQHSYTTAGDFTYNIGTTVDPAKTELAYGGNLLSLGTSVFTSPVAMYLLNSTTVQMVKQNGGNATVNFMLIEFE